MNYKKASYISGVIIFFSFLLFFGSILWLSGERILSAKEYKVFIKFPDVVGLKDHSSVFMRGYRIGWTKDVKFESDGILVRVDIKRRFHIPIDSRIEINTMNFIGEKAITITPGTSAEVLKPLGILHGENKDIVIIAKSILTAIKSKIDEGSFDHAVQQITEIVSNSHTVVRKMVDKIEKVDIDSYNRQVIEIGEAAKKLREFADNTQDSMNRFSAESTTTLQNLNRSLALFSELSTEITQIAQKLNRGDGTAGELLNSKVYLENLNTTVLELKLLIEDIEKNPKKYVDLSIF